MENPIIETIDFNDIPSEIYFQTSSQYGFDIISQQLRKGLNIKIEKKEKGSTRLRLDKLDLNQYKNNSELLGIKIENNVVAFVQYGFDVRTQRFEIYNIFVEEIYRRRGFATLLTEEIFRNMDHGRELLAVRVRSDNSVCLDFFVNLNFEITGLDILAFSDDGLEKQSIELILSRYKSKESKNEQY